MPLRRGDANYVQFVSAFTDLVQPHINPRYLRVKRKGKQGSMASQVPLRWLWRDARMVPVLLVWAAFAVGLLIYFNGGILPHAASAAGRAPVAAAPPRAAVDDTHYTGSLVLVPRSGDECRKLIFDNRTGIMWEGGSFDCYTMAKTRGPQETLGIARMQALHAAFHKK